LAKVVVVFHFSFFIFILIHSLLLRLQSPPSLKNFCYAKR